MVLRMKKFYILRVHWKIRFLDGRSQKTKIYWGLPKKGGLGHFADLKGGLGKKEGGGFLRGVDASMHTMELFTIEEFNY